MKDVIYGLLMKKFLSILLTALLAAVSALIVPLFRPIGLGDWRIVTSLVCGFIAKESVVSVMEVLFKDGTLRVPDRVAKLRGETGRK